MEAILNLFMIEESASNTDKLINDASFIIVWLRDYHRVINIIKK